jgi:hypothetical protein
VSDVSSGRVDVFRKHLQSCAPSKTSPTPSGLSSYLIISLAIHNINNHNACTFPVRTPGVHLDHHHIDRPGVHVDHHIITSNHINHINPSTYAIPIPPQAYLKSIIHPPIHTFVYLPNYPCIVSPYTVYMFGLGLIYLFNYLSWWSRCTPSLRTGTV